MERLYNFNPGPATLPIEVLWEVHDRFMSFGGMSILEISHRSKAFADILNEARSLVRRLMNLPDDYEILLLQGGASLQFAMVPMNLLQSHADYAVTGHWSRCALAEARHVGEARVIYSSEEGGFRRTPRSTEITATPGADFVHITTNNTIYGTQYHEIPDTGDVPLVADMSSDILSRRIDVNNFALIYAGAQKNLGPAGLTLVVIRKDLVGRHPRELPAILTYRAHAEKGSLYNTPPVFAIFALGRVLAWLERLGGIEAIERINREKARILYDALDASDFYTPHADADSRSLMNITFTLPSSELAERFVAEASRQGMVGLKGHRTVGGIRASIYNAFPREGLEALASFMREFERTA